MQYKIYAGHVVYILNPSTSTVKAEAGIRQVSIVSLKKKGLFNINSLKAEVFILPNANDMPDIGIRVNML